MKAAAPARAAVSADGLFSLLLPGTWASIPLLDDEAAAKRIAALVKRQVGMNDRLAGRRRQLRDELTKAARDAAENGAISFQIALEIIAGVPFPGSIMSRLDDWPAGAKGETAAERLASAFPAGEQIETGAGPGMRIAETGTTTYVDETTPSLSLEYWIPAPSGTRLLLTLVELPMITDPEIFVELFDTVMSSIEWVEAAEVAVVRSGGADAGGAQAEPQSDDA